MQDPPPPSHGIEDAPVIPEANASWFSLLTFQWITGILSLGYARPLEPEDLFKLQDSRAAALTAEKILRSFEARQVKADEYNARLKDGKISPGWRHLWWFLRGNRQEAEKKWREGGGFVKPSLVLAMNDSVAWWFWSGGIMKVTADVSQVLSPLLVKVRRLYCALASTT